MLANIPQPRSSTTAMVTLCAVIGFASWLLTETPAQLPAGRPGGELIDPQRTKTGMAQDSDQPLPERVSFNAHIRPIMSNTCFACHGPDEAANESGLRLDSFEAAIAGGAIEAGAPQSSLVYQRLTSSDDPMPPADFLHQLTDHEIAMFRKWIEQGAKYEPHWSYAPIQRPAVPVVKQTNRVVNEIDAFILARLELDGIKSADRADRATLLRRLSLDLIGLPPTPAEVAAFLNDQSPTAYQTQVERLLASPQYGERMASQWLDLVRFTDTVGYHGDQNQRVFAYRDYVINALNNNKPFDQFTREQLAGDLLENSTDEQRIATALLRLNMMTREGGAQPGEYLAKYTADRVRMLGTAWLGVTTGCCQCHNHKYDPLTIKDFYSLGAFFDDIRQWGVYTTYGYTPNPDLEGFTNDSPFPPELRSPSDSLRQQIDYLESAMANLIATESAAGVYNSAPFQAWIQSLAGYLNQNRDGWQPIDVVAAHSVDDNTTMRILPDNSVLLTGPPTPDNVVTLTGRISAPVAIKMIQLEVLPDEAHGGHVGRAKQGRFHLSLSAAIDQHPTDEVNLGSLGSDTTAIPFEFTQVDRLNPNGYNNGFESYFLTGVWRSGPAAWQLPSDETELPHTAVYHLSSPKNIVPGDQLQFKIASPDVGRVRISVSPLTRFVAGLPAATESLGLAVQAYQAGQQLSPEQRAVLLSAYYFAITPANSISSSASTYRDLVADCRSGYSMTMVAVSADPQNWHSSRILPRGNWQDESGEQVVAATPGFLPQTAATAGRRLSRLDLADWLVSPENPLTARHYVNRTWKHFFGTGLSNQLDDLGNQGEWPSHPELLDWLADEFRTTWDMKHLTRLIVNSRTYQQQVAEHRPLVEVDPLNRLLSAQSPRRLEAEIIRDNALAISGLLLAKFTGGPSVFPYQPEGHYSNLQFPDRGYEASPFELQYRRGVYVHWQRTFLHPMLVNFDAPSRDECVADRAGSNSPQQALTLLNDPQFVEASVAFADRLLAENPDSDFPALLDFAFRLAVSRSPSDAERTGLADFFAKQHDYYANHVEEIDRILAYDRRDRRSRNIHPIDLAAWSQVCRVILNLHETITRY